jgi:hypothetical protein
VAAGTAEDAGSKLTYRTCTAGCSSPNRRRHGVSDGGGSLCEKIGSRLRAALAPALRQTERAVNRRERVGRLANRQIGEEVPMLDIKRREFIALVGGGGLIHAHSHNPAIILIYQMFRRGYMNDGVR